MPVKYTVNTPVITYLLCALWHIRPSESLHFSHTSSHVLQPASSLSLPPPGGLVLSCLLFPLWHPGHCSITVAIPVLSSYAADRLRDFTSSLSSFVSLLPSYSSMPTWSRHWLCRILHRHRFWNTSTALSSPLFIIYVSPPFSKTGMTRVLLYSLSFVLLEMVLDPQIPFNLTNAPLAFASLFFRSFMSPPSLQTNQKTKSRCRTRLTDEMKKSDEWDSRSTRKRRTWWSTPETKTIFLLMDRILRRCYRYTSKYKYINGSIKYINCFGLNLWNNHTLFIWITDGGGKKAGKSI